MFHVSPWKGGTRETLQIYIYKKSGQSGWSKTRNVSGFSECSRTCALQAFDHFVRQPIQSAKIETLRDWRRVVMAQSLNCCPLSSNVSSVEVVGQCELQIRSARRCSHFRREQSLNNLRRNPATLGKLAEVDRLA